MGAVGAELVVDDEVDEVGLLKDGTIEDLTTNIELEAEAFGEGVGPDELDVDETDETGEVEVVEVEGEELLGLRAGGDPGVRGVEVSGNNASTHLPHPIPLEHDNNGVPNGTRARERWR